MKRILTVLGVTFGTIFVLLLAAFFYYLGVTRGITLDAEKLTLETVGPTILDGEGQPIEAAALEKDIPFEEFPPYLPKAFVAVEDRRFYTHSGFDPRGIARAVLKNLRSFSFREGASTISQQLIKNTHLTGEKTLSRKLKEFKLTRVLEKRYSKDEIMELYLNSIYFGHSAFGIGNAASFYFGKKTSDLTVGESAMLAALVRSPNRYSPFIDAEKCLARRDLVLSLMKEQGFLDEKAYDEAKAEALPLSPAKSPDRIRYLDLVYKELEDIFPDAETSSLSGLRIYTAFDPELQKILSSFEAEHDLAIFVRSTKGNAVKAFHATAGMLRRLPASTIKPLLVYGPAIEEGLISPATPVLDERTDFSGYYPDDAGGATGEYMSVRYALAHSVNIPAVKILNSMGIERGAEYLERMGMHVPKEDLSLALALGGMREGFTLKELSDGYATFAKGGCFAPSKAILSIRDKRGRTLYESPSYEQKIFSEGTSFLMQDMLSTAAKEGTAKRLSGLPFFVAAKTGTAEGAKGNTDAYTMAFTSEDVVGVWAGNKDNSPIPSSGGGLPANLAKKVLEKLYEQKTPGAPQRPQSVVRLSCDKNIYKTEHRLVRCDPIAPPIEGFEEWFKEEFVPTEQSTKFSHPTIKNPQICVKNGCVNIVLCQEEYYSYIVKRKHRGEVATIYEGAYCRDICDNSVQSGECYSYTVIPVYKGHAGVPVELPSVQIARSDALPENWWED